jgi:hypothetical protein
MEHLSLPKFLRHYRPVLKAPLPCACWGASERLSPAKRQNGILQWLLAGEPLGYGGGIAIAKLPVQRCDTLAHTVDNPGVPVNFYSFIASSEVGDEPVVNGGWSCLHTVPSGGNVPSIK